MNTPDRPGKPEYSEDPMLSFLKHILYNTNRSYRNVVHAHYGGRYDHVLALGKLYTMDVCVDKIIATGNKILGMTIKQRGRMRGMKLNYTTSDFHDSFNIISLPLSEMPKTFDLKDEEGEELKEKGIFPYLYNQPENYNKRLEHLPDVDEYNTNNMKRKQYEAFVKWRKKHYRSEFWLPQILDEYCTQDTKILAFALISLLNQIKDITKGDIVRYFFNFGYILKILGIL